jgi:pectinesterase
MKAVIVALALLLAPSFTRAQHDAVVNAGHRGADGAVTAGVPTYRTISAALKAAPASATTRHTILIRNGRYREKLTVDKPNIGFVGESRTGTVLTYDDAAGYPAPGGGTLGTRGSATLTITARGFRLRGMTVENAFNYAANAAKADTDTTKLSGSQGVAVLLEAASDQAIFTDCALHGNQDTLFTDAGRSWFSSCVISGNVDFIFGAGVAVFEGVDIISRDRGSRTNNGYVSAPSTSLSSPFGLVFLRSRLLKESAAMAPASVTLGRPWHPGADRQAVGSAVFIECYMDDHISSAGWSRISSRNAAGEQIWYEPVDARLFEYRSHGPGSEPSDARRQLTSADAQYFTVAQVLRGWDPAREVR